MRTPNSTIGSFEKLRSTNKQIRFRRCGKGSFLPSLLAIVRLLSRSVVIENVSFRLMADDMTVSLGDSRIQMEIMEW